MVRAPQSLGSTLLSVLFLGMMVVYAKASTIYAEKGKSVTLKPTTETPGITSISWNHGRNLAAEWFQQTGGVTCYNQFKGRCEADHLTGALTITRLTSEDAGDFSVDINYNAAGKFDLKIISSIAQPSISQSCDKELTNCLLTCEGEIPDAEPITYGWPGVDGHSDRELRITKDMKIESFSCVMENPVSNKSSESIPNPLMSPKTADLTPLWVLVVVVVVALGVTAYYIYINKRKSGEDGVSFHQVPTNDPSSQGAGGIEFKDLRSGNHTHSNGNVPGEGANHSPSPVGPQNGPQRAEVSAEAERPDQSLPAPEPEDSTEYVEVSAEDEMPDLSLPAPEPQDSTEYDEVSAEYEMPDLSLPAPEPQDSTEYVEVSAEYEMPDQSLPAPEPQDSTEYDETLH